MALNQGVLGAFSEDGCAFGGRHAERACYFAARYCAACYFYGNGIMKKRLFFAYVAVMAAAVAVGLASCGKDEPTAPATTKSVAASASAPAGTGPTAAAVSTRISSRPATRVTPRAIGGGVYELPPDTNASPAGTGTRPASGGFR
jgi:hypothetical protein